MLSALPYVLASAFLVPGILALLIRNPRRSRVVGFGGGAVASFLSLVATLAGAMREVPMRIPLPAPVPWTASELFLDGLSAFFLALVFFIGFLVSVYAVGYMKEFDAHRRGQAAPLLMNLLLLSMAFVVSAGDMLSFLLGWEAMSLASYFLVVLDHEKKEARQAGLIYLIATHIGTGGILLAFLFLVRTTGSFSFNGFATVPIADPSIVAAAFGFALLGFGTKAGIFPFHIWLPYAHPEAPSPVSAVMSGVMIKMGIYGIVRFLFFLLPSPPASFGATLLALGLLSGVFGVLYAIIQHDLKRLLAFHSVENIGIILIGIGAASLCQVTGRPDAARLLLAGGLLALASVRALGQGRELVTRGPYRWVRHPYYLGILVMLVGAIVAMRSLPALILFYPAVRVTLLRARREEHNLGLRLGDAYHKYQERVAFMLPLRPPLPQAPKP